MKLLEWLVFNTLIPLMPVGVVFGLSWFGSDSGNPPKKIFSIIKDGQVFFYCTAITAVALGDLAKVPTGFDILPWVMAMIVIIIISTSAFAGVAHDQKGVKENKFGWTSVIMAFVATSLIAAFRETAGLL